VGKKFFARRRHVADRQEMARNDHSKCKTRLEGGFVPAWKYPACVRRLELAGQHTLYPAVGGVIDKEEAAIELVDLRRERDAQPVRADCQRLRERECRRLARGVECDLGVVNAIVHGHGSDRDVDRIEHQPRRRLAHLDVDHLDAGKREAVGIRPQFDRVIVRNDRLRQFPRRGIKSEGWLCTRCITKRQHQREQDTRTSRQGCCHITFHDELQCQPTQRHS
jgi:hypothetical protein